jgi:hypothetical protein
MASGRDREYDRFGPWVLQISDEDPAPPLFVPALRRDEQPLISVKIPRKIARRDAHPGMDLYDCVVSLYEAEMVVLERLDGAVRERVIAYHDIHYLSIHEELLRGRLNLGIPRNPCSLHYNAVSKDIMARVAELIRTRQRAGHGPAADLPAEPEHNGLSFYFERLLRDERAAEGQATLLAAQPQVALGGFEPSLARRLLFGVVDKRLLESIHLCDGRDLRIIDRGRPFAFRWQTVYGRRETIIPLSNVIAVEWDEETGDGATAALMVGTEGGHETWGFARDNHGARAYRDWLSGLVVGRG